MTVRMRLTVSTLVLAGLLATIQCDLDADSMCCTSESDLLERGGCSIHNSSNRHPIRLQCSFGRFLIDPNIDPVEKFEVHAGNLVQGHLVVQQGQFCVGRLAQQDNGVLVASAKPVAVVCFGDYTAADNKMFVTGLLTLISVVFLFMTLVVYLTLPQLRDLQGKCTMCVCLSLALGFLSLAMLQLALTQINEIMCSANGFIIYFWMISTFLWMNVVSINVWRSVALTRSRKKESTQFVWYSAYAWGVAVALLLITVITNYVEGDHIRPGIDGSQCWFTGRRETWLYFYGPIAVLLLCNIALFVLTSIKLWKLNKDYDNALNMRNLKFKFLMYLKLFLVMGISWIFEIASFAHGKEDAVIWYITDVFNCLQGFLFFLVLVVCRKKAMRGLAERGLLGPFSAAALRHYAVEDDEECEIMDVDDDTQAPMSP